MKTITIIIFSIFLNACGSAKEANASANMTQNINDNLNGSFIVSKLGESTTLKEALTINFDDATKRVSGFSGCNNFSGNYKIDGNKIEFGPLMSTKKMCQGIESEIESTFFKTIEKTNKFEIKGNKITLLKNKKELLSADQIISSKIAQTQEEAFSFEYSEFTRGTFKMVKVTEKEITSQFSRSEKAQTKPCDKTDWEKLKTLCNSFNISTLPNLEVPSKAHQFDGAAHATLTITDGEKTYTTLTFDGGNPPKEIADLVNKILDLATPETKKEN
ncbi:MAG: META domain-containing protein [Olleya sp.]